MLHLRKNRPQKHHRKITGPYQKYRRVLYLQSLHNLPLRGKQLRTFETFRLQNCDALKKHQTHIGGPAVPQMSHSCTIQCPANKSTSISRSLLNVQEFKSLTLRRQHSMMIPLFFVHIQTRFTEYFPTFLKTEMLHPKVTSETRENTWVLSGSNCGAVMRRILRPCFSLAERHAMVIRDVCPGYANRE